MATHVLNLELELLLCTSLGTLYVAAVFMSIYCRLEIDLPALVAVEGLVAEGSYLEGEVLEEVRSAVVLLGLGPGAGINPDADCGCLSPWRVLGSDLYNGEGKSGQRY